MKKFLLLLPLFCLINACVSVPSELAVDSKAITSLTALEQQPQAALHQEVRLGGKILKVRALAQATQLEILSFPISNLSAKPQVGAKPNGRFIAYIKGFIEPETLKQQYITLVGQFSQMEQGKIGQAHYTYPAIRVEHYKLWHLVKTYYYDAPWHYHWYPRPLFWQIDQVEWQTRYDLY